MPDALLPNVPVLVDWSNSFPNRPRLYYRPRSIDELKECLRGLAAGKPYKPDSIRFIGSLHSTCDLNVSDTIIDSCDLPHILEFDADKSAVVASANWRIHDFLIELSKATPRGKSIAATGGTDEQTLAGVISTHTAPATDRVTMYDLIDWIEYITFAPDGSVVEKRVAGTDPAFRAVVCSLGVIGVMTKVRWRLIDEPYYEVTQDIRTLDAVLGDLKATAAQWDFWRINWIPKSDKGLFWGAKLLPGKGDPNGDYPKDTSENAIRDVMDFIQKVTKDGPTLDWEENILLKTLAAFYGTVKCSGPLRNMIPVDRDAPLKVALGEWSFDPADMAKVFEVCRSYYADNGWPNLPIEIQLTKCDDRYMSPWNWPGLDRIIKFDFQYLTDKLSQAHKDAIVTHLVGLWRSFEAEGIKFKGHWGKITGADYAFVKANHQLDQFAPFIQPLFVNDYLRTRLLPPR